MGVCFYIKLDPIFYPTCFANSSHDKKKEKNALAFNVYVAFSTYYTSQKVQHAFEVESKQIFRFQGVSVYKLCIVMVAVYSNFMNHNKKNLTPVNNS